MCVETRRATDANLRFRQVPGRAGPRSVFFPRSALDRRIMSPFSPDLATVSGVGDSVSELPVWRTQRFSSFSVNPVLSRDRCGTLPCRTRRDERVPSTSRAVPYRPASGGRRDRCSVDRGLACRRASDPAGHAPQSPVSMPPPFRLPDADRGRPCVPREARWATRRIERKRSTRRPSGNIWPLHAGLRYRAPIPAAVSERSFAHKPVEADTAEVDPETQYAMTPDGIYIAYQVVGEGPVDVAWQLDFVGNVDLMWESPLWDRCSAASHRSRG